jgi:hypothetical protein
MNPFYRWKDTSMLQAMNEKMRSMFFMPKGPPKYCVSHKMWEKLITKPHHPGQNENQL